MDLDVLLGDACQGDGGVVGDYEMPAYDEDDVKERRAKLSEFLEKMGW
jgi:putative ABC transport system ATP-binding protein